MRENCQLAELVELRKKNKKNVEENTRRKIKLGGKTGELYSVRALLSYHFNPEVQTNFKDHSKEK